MKKILGWLMLAITLFFGYTRSLPPKVTSLPPAKTHLVYVGNLHLSEVPKLSEGAVALYPSKAGRVGEKWGLLEVLATGSRSPLPPDAPRVPLERAYVSTEDELQLKDRIAALPAGERLLVVGLMTEGDHGEVVGDGWKFREAVLLGKDVPEGLLTSPSVRFRPGLIAATDIAATALGTPFGAGRPAVLLPGRSLNLEKQRELWKQQGAVGLVVIPWLLTPLLLLAAWKKWERLGRLVLAIPLAMLLTPLLEAPLYPFSGLDGRSSALAVLFLATVALAVWTLPVKKIAFVIALVLWAGVTLGVPLLEYNTFSYSLAEAARFYGIGNEGAGLLMGCALAAGFELPALLAVALAIGLPTLGANNGCFIAALAAVVLTAPTLKLRLGLAALALLLVGGVVRWEASRAPQVRSHLGQAVTKGGGGLAELAGRKLAMSGYLLVRSPWMLLLVSTAWLAWREKKKKELVVALLALALNDSGVLAAATLLLPITADQKTDTPPE